jgi:hypothetical protein
MRQSLVVVACAECGVHWGLEKDEPRCSDPDHDHQRFDLHLHLSKVALPSGAEVIAASFDAEDPYTRDDPPDYGLYLDRRWDPPWPHDYVDWPDFGLPEDPVGLKMKLQAVLRRAQAGERVEIGCLGGHGRTGTALGCLAVWDGVPSTEAVAWVRQEYCVDAIETADQEAFLRAVGERPIF